jgi:hypothetical protein
MRLLLGPSAFGKLFSSDWSLLEDVISVLTSILAGCDLETEPAARVFGIVAKVVQATSNNPNIVANMDVPIFMGGEIKRYLKGVRRNTSSSLNSEARKPKRERNEP